MLTDGQHAGHVVVLAIEDAAHHEDKAILAGDGRACRPQHEFGTVSCRVPVKMAG
jgi:hypothetical protein